jgi:hypothetical protein
MFDRIAGRENSEGPADIGAAQLAAFEEQANQLHVAGRFTTSSVNSLSPALP